MHIQAKWEKTPHLWGSWEHALIFALTTANSLGKIFCLKCVCNGGDAGQLQTQMWAKSSGVARLTSPSQPEVDDRGPKRMLLGGQTPQGQKESWVDKSMAGGTKEKWFGGQSYVAQEERIVLGGQSR